MKLINDNLDEIIALSESHMVKKLEVFGSISNGTFNDKSDIDFIITFMEMSQEDFARIFFSFEEKLTMILGRRIDLLISKDLINKRFLTSINPQRKTIYEKR